MPDTAARTILVKKTPDARSTLTLVRAEGSRNWGKLHPSFPEHDLMHLAVESVLGATEEFFGPSGHA